jgi:hypothetical protein
MIFSRHKNIKLPDFDKKREFRIIISMKMSFIFVNTNIPMKKSAFFLFILLGTLFVSSCTSSRGTAGAGCNMNRNLVGYK